MLLLDSARYLALTVTWKALLCLSLLTCFLLQDKQRGSVSLAGTPLADITSRHQQSTPVALHPFTKPLSTRAGAAPSALITPVMAAQESVEEQCLSAGRWLRGLADECLEAVYTPARLQHDDAAGYTQVCHETVCDVIHAWGNMLHSSPAMTCLCKCFPPHQRPVILLAS